MHLIRDENGSFSLRVCAAAWCTSSRFAFGANCGWVAFRNRSAFSRSCSDFLRSACARVSFFFGMVIASHIWPCHGEGSRIQTLLLPEWVVVSLDFLSRLCSPRCCSGDPHDGSEQSRRNGALQ